MAIKDDFTFTKDGSIRHVSGDTVYTVAELLHYIWDEWGEESIVAAGSHLITMEDPVNIDEESVKYVKEGTIVICEPGSKKPHTIYSSIADYRLW